MRNLNTIPSITHKYNIINNTEYVNKSNIIIHYHINKLLISVKRTSFGHFVPSLIRCFKIVNNSVYALMQF